LPSTSPGGTQPPFTFSDPVVLTPAPIRMAERKIRGDLDLAVVKVPLT
jgi:hypothetical protein